MARLQTFPKFQVVNDAGAPIAGAKIYSYLAGTSTPQATFTDQTGATQNANPTICDGSGKAAIWLAANLGYKIVVADAADVVLITIDGINLPDGGYFTTLNATGATVLGSTLAVAGQITSTAGSGVAPLVVSVGAAIVTNLDADKLDGGDWQNVPDDGTSQALIRGKAHLPLTLKTNTSTGSGLPGPEIHIETDDGMSGQKGGDILLKPGTASGGTPGNVQTLAKDTTLQEIQKTVELAQWVRGQITEEITLSTVGATTDSTANMLPANAIIEAVVARVTQTITTATDWKLGDATSTGRFLAAQSGAQLTAGATAVGLLHQQGAIATDALGPVQTAAAKLRITTTGTPGAGKIRVAVFYRQFVAPTS